MKKPLEVFFIAVLLFLVFFSIFTFYNSNRFLISCFSKKYNISPHLIDNFHKVHYFYQNEMTVPENKPVKLISTNSTIPRTAIFGLIMEYRATNIHFFFESLACTGYNGTLIVLYCKLDDNTKRYIISFSTFFEIIMIPIKTSKDVNGITEYVNKYTCIKIYKNETIQKKIVFSSFEKVDIIQLDFECGDFRFEVAHYLYKNHFFDDYDLLFMTDIGDVIFQSDIRFFNYSEGAYIVEEAGISIKDSHYWLSMYMADFSSFENKCELCIGTLILVGKKGFSFLNGLHNQINDHLDLIVLRPNFQGTLNFLIYNNTYNYSDDFVHFITTRHGIINSVAKLNGHMMNFNKKNRFRRVRNIYDIYYHDKNFLLYNQDFQKLAVIHHTKYIPIIQNWTFKGILNTCKQLYPQNYKEIMKNKEKFLLEFV